MVEFLHEKEVLHKAIRVGRVWIGGKEVRLEGGLWGRRLVDLNKSNPWTEAGFGGEELPESWLVCSFLADCLKKSSVDKTDCFF